jgi:hypothetical protein
VPSSHPITRPLLAPVAELSAWSDVAEVTELSPYEAAAVGRGNGIGEGWCSSDGEERGSGMAEAVIVKGMMRGASRRTETEPIQGDNVGIHRLRMDVHTKRQMLVCPHKHTNPDSQLKAQPAKQICLPRSQAPFGADPRPTSPRSRSSWGGKQNSRLTQHGLTRCTEGRGRGTCCRVRQMVSGVGCYGRRAGSVVVVELVSLDTASTHRR